MSNKKELKRLYASNIQMTTLPDLSGDNQLHEIYLQNNKLTDISGLNGLKEVYTLDLSNNNIEDISPLKSMEHLRALYCNDNKISDIKPISHLPLNELKLNNNKIYDCSEMRFSDARYMYCYGSFDVQNQTPQINVEFQGNPIIKLPILSTGEKPTVENISDGGVYDKDTNTIKWEGITKETNVSFEMSNSTQLYYVFDSCTWIDTKFLYSGKVEVNLKPQDCCIKDANLKEAILESQGRDISENLTKEDLEKITSLDLSSKNLSSMEGLQYCTNLQSLNLSNNQIKNIDYIENLSKLKDLNLSSNKISDLRNLKIPDSLENLNLENQNVTFDDVNADEDVEVSNDIWNVDGTSVSNIYDINENGEYDKENNLLKWSDLVNNITLQYSFESNINYKNINIIFSGKVNRDVKLNEVPIKNDKLKNAIIRRLGNGVNVLSKGLVKNTTSLDLSGESLESIEGLEYFTSLKSLNLQNNKISDLKPLKDLQELEELDLSKNNIDNLDSVEGLADLTSLKSLNLQNNKISDLKLLRSLQKLEKLDVSSNNISNLNSVEESGYFTSLKYLNLKNNNISDLQPLKFFDSLEELDVSNNYISDVAVIKGFKSLKTIKAEDETVILEDASTDKDITFSNPIIDVDGDIVFEFSYFGQYTHYNRKNNTFELKNIKGDKVFQYKFKNETQYKNIDMSFSGVAKKKIHVNEVDIGNEALKKAIIASYNSHKYEIDCYYVLTQAILDEITTLNIDYKNIDSFDGIEKCTSLEKIVLEYCKVNNFDALSRCENLKELDITRCNEKGLNQISKLKNLEQLRLAEVSCDNMDAIKNMTNLIVLKIENSKISDLSFLKTLNKLFLLTLKNDGIEDISPVTTLLNLQYLNIDENAINDISCLSKMPNLKSVSALRQYIVLPSVISHGDVEVINNVKYIDGFYVDSMSDIYSDSVYNKENNTVKWTDLESSRSLRYRFEKNSYYTGKNINFSGSVVVYAKLDAVYFEDKSLKEVMCKKLLQEDIGYLPKEVAQKVTSLDLSDLNIKSIKGLENFTSLTSLNLKHNKIKDLKPLSKLTSLKSLNLDCNNITDIKPLEELNNLEDLHLNYQYYYYGNVISYDNKLRMKNPLRGVDRSAITYISGSGFLNGIDNSFEWKNVDKDSTLECRFNTNVNVGKVKAQFSGSIIGNGMVNVLKFSDENFKKVLYKILGKDESYIMRKEDIKNIKYLDLSKEFDLENVEDLRMFTELRTLKLPSKMLRNLGVLNKLTNLESLKIRGVVGDYSAIKSLKNLKSIDVSNTVIETLSFLKGLNKLECIIAENNPFINDIEVMRDFSNLKYLSLKNVRKNIDLSPLSSLKKLKSLSLLGTAITDFSPIGSIESLQYLNLSNNPYCNEWGNYFDNPLKDLNFLSNLSNLKELYLEKNKISDYSALRKLPNLKVLDLNGGYLKENSKDVIKDLVNLESLSIGSTLVSDISFLGDLKNLKELCISTNEISDISVLASLSKLEKLDIAMNDKINDISCLKSCTNLKILRSKKNPNISSNQFSELKNAIPDINIKEELC